MAIAVTAVNESVARLRKRLGLAFTFVAVGIAVSVSFDESLGAWLTLGALAFLLLTLHRFGRSGPE
jgi:hypothetical protein